MTRENTEFTLMEFHWLRHAQKPLQYLKGTLHDKTDTSCYAGPKWVGHDTGIQRTPKTEVIGIS